MAMNVGALRHMVTISNPPTTVPDADGGFSSVPALLATVRASVEPATARSLERLVASTVAAEASHVVTIRYIAGVTTKSVVTFKGRILDVIGVQNPEERNIELRLACVERVA